MINVWPRGSTEYGWLPNQFVGWMDSAPGRHKVEQADLTGPVKLQKWPQEGGIQLREDGT